MFWVAELKMLAILALLLGPTVKVASSRRCQLSIISPGYAA